MEIDSNIYSNTGTSNYFSWTERVKICGMPEGCSYGAYMIGL